MRFFFLISLLLAGSQCLAQNPAPASTHFTLQLKNGYALVFLKKEQSSALYLQPRIKTKSILKKIEGFDEHNYSSRRVKPSPDGSYVVIDHIIKGYVQQSPADSVLHENYGCVIVDLRKAKVVQYLQSDCDGDWNHNNEWISHNQVIFHEKRQ